MSRERVKGIIVDEKLIWICECGHENSSNINMSVINYEKKKNLPPVHSKLCQGPGCLTWCLVEVDKLG